MSSSFGLKKFIFLSQSPFFKTFICFWFHFMFQSQKSEVKTENSAFRPSLVSFFWRDQDAPTSSESWVLSAFYVCIPSASYDGLHRWLSGAHIPPNWTILSSHLSEDT